MRRLRTVYARPLAALVSGAAATLLLSACLVIENGPADTTKTGEKASVAAAKAAKAARESIAVRIADFDTLSALGSEPDSVRTPPATPHASTGDITRVEPLVPATDAEIAILKSEIAMPIATVAPSQLFDSFDEKRGSNRRHEAIDIPAPRRTPVLSAAAGRVMRLYSSKDGGLMVYAAEATDRFILMYAHLDGYAPGLADGATLARGQTIGYVGTTGNAPPNLPHLHFAIARTPNVARWWTGVPVNPYPLLHHP